MADPTDIALTVGGWIIAGVVTALGIWYAHRKQVEDQRGQEDASSIYRPLRKEMEAVIADERNMTWGGIIWSPSEEYRDLRRRGLLQPARHDTLRREVEILEELHRKHGPPYGEFYNARVDAIGKVLAKAEVQLVDGEKRSLLSVIQVQPTDNQLHSALVGDRERWLERFNQLQGESSRQGGKADWRTENPQPAELFVLAEKMTAEARRAYQGTANAVLSQARKIREILDRSIREVG